MAWGSVRGGQLLMTFSWLECVHRFARPANRLACGLVAGITGMDALIPTPIRFHAIRTDFGRPNSSIRFRAFTAMAASVA